MTNKKKWFSVDNRRLYMFRVLNVLGRLNYIEVKQWKEHNREITTGNLGCHVTVRNRKIDNRWKFGETYKHCSCVDGRNHKLPSKIVNVVMKIRIMSLKNCLACNSNTLS